MLGFKKHKIGKLRKFTFLKWRLYAYQKPPSEKELQDAMLQESLHKAFWRSPQREVAAERTDAIVTLTSFGERVDSVYLTIESIFQQSVKPKKVLLWLDEAEFDAASLPSSLYRAQDRGLDIRFCKNTRSYKKIIPALKVFRNDILVTIDDDIMYPSSFLENLLESHKQQPAVVMCYRAHLMCLESASKLRPYAQWQSCVSNRAASWMLFPTGAGGVLYPPQCFDDEVLNEGVFLSLCATADDVWLKAMSLKNGVKTALVSGDCSWSILPPYIKGTQQNCLADVNIKEGNDLQLARVFDHYNLWGSLIEDD